MPITTTKGAWRAVLPRGNISKAQVISDDGSFPNGMFGVAHIYGDSDEETAANARLIATAPELLATLESLVVSIQEDVPLDSVTRHFRWSLDDARAAISKARGE